MKQQQIYQKLEAVEGLLKAEHQKPFNTTQASQYLGISKSTLFKLSSTKRIPYFKPGGKLIYFTKSDLDAFIFRNRQASESELEAEVTNKIKNRKGVTL